MQVRVFCLSPVSLPRASWFPSVSFLLTIIPHQPEPAPKLTENRRYPTASSCARSVEPTRRPPLPSRLPRRLLTARARAPPLLAAPANQAEGGAARSFRRMAHRLLPESTAVPPPPPRAQAAAQQHRGQGLVVLRGSRGRGPPVLASGLRGSACSPPMGRWSISPRLPCE